MFDRNRYQEQSKTSPGSRSGWWVGAAFALIVLLQCLFGLAGIANNWVAGHNGYNGAAYHQAARNSLRFGLLFPAQYHCDRTKLPLPKKLYTHHPLALHGHGVMSLWLFGDHEWAVRLTPALNGFLALIALLVIVKRHWGDAHALIAGSVYVMLPINHSYANMVNHSTGFILWSLLTLECYLHWIEARNYETHTPSHARVTARWLAAFFLCSFVVMQWDWPAYYVMAAIAVHWFLRIIRFAGKLTVAKELGLLALFCIMILVSSFGFFGLVHRTAGSLSDLTASAYARTVYFPGIWKTLWKKVIQPDLSVPVLLCGALWLLGVIIRFVRRELRNRDLIPITFCFAGITHFIIFKNTALVHAYWPWPLNPFFAIAASSVLLWLGAWLGSRARERLEQNASLASDGLALKAAGVVPLIMILAIFYFAYLAHTLPLIEKGRRYGGVFSEPGYVSMAELILFSKAVRDQTTPDTVIHTHPSLRYQVQMNVSLDRTWRRARRLKVSHRQAAVSGPSVVIGAVTGTDPKEIAAAATQYRYRQYGDHYLVDYRYPGQDIQIYEWEKCPASLYWRFWVDPFEPPRRPARDLQAESRFESTLVAHRTEH